MIPRYVQESTTLMLPANTGDPASMIAQAVKVFENAKQKSGLSKDAPVVPNATVPRSVDMKPETTSS